MANIEEQDVVSTSIKSATSIESTSYTLCTLINYKGSG